MMSRLGILTLALVTLLCSPPAAGAQDTAAPAAPDTAQPVVLVTGIPVVVGRDTLFRVEAGVGSFSATDRARAVAERVRDAARDPRTDAALLEIVEGERQTDIVLGERVLVSVTEGDAAAAGVERAAVAAAWGSAIAQVLERQSFWSLVTTVAVGVLAALLVVLVVYWVFRLVNRTVYPRVQGAIARGREGAIPALRLQRLEIISATRVADALSWIAAAARIVVLVLLLYLALPLVLGFFPWTEDLASQLFDYVLAPARTGVAAMASYLPELFTIAFIVLATWAALKAIHVVFRGMETGSIALPGFDRDFAEPTYKIVRFLVIVLAAILIWPNLPKSDSAEFKGIAAFLGLLISLGSAGAVANVVGGLVTIYMRPFREGDRVRIADTVGDVVEKSLLITRLRTIKNVDVTIPNSLILSSHIINYSSSAAGLGLVLHTSVTIGYDVPWRRVHELLIEAARRTPEILDEPAPFVFQTALSDFYVAYEINAYTDRPGVMARTYSLLHENIQDAFNEAGVEIMSPHYAAMRDGNEIAIPPGSRPPDYRAPAFRVSGIGGSPLPSRPRPEAPPPTAGS